MIMRTKSFSWDWRNYCSSPSFWLARDHRQLMLAAYDKSRPSLITFSRNVFFGTKTRFLIRWKTWNDVPKDSHVLLLTRAYLVFSSLVIIGFEWLGRRRKGLNSRLELGMMTKWLGKEGSGEAGGRWEKAKRMEAVGKWERERHASDSDELELESRVIDNGISASSISGGHKRMVILLAISHWHSKALQHHLACYWMSRRHLYLWNSHETVNDMDLTSTHRPLYYSLEKNLGSGRKSSSVWCPLRVLALDFLPEKNQNQRNGQCAEHRSLESEQSKRSLKIQKMQSIHFYEYTYSPSAHANFSLQKEKTKEEKRK